MDKHLAPDIPQLKKPPLAGALPLAAAVGLLAAAAVLDRAPAPPERRLPVALAPGAPAVAPGAQFRADNIPERPSVPLLSRSVLRPPAPGEEETLGVLEAGRPAGAVLALVQLKEMRARNAALRSRAADATGESAASAALLQFEGSAGRGAPVAVALGGSETPRVPGGPGAAFAGAGPGGGAGAPDGGRAPASWRPYRLPSGPLREASGRPALASLVDLPHAAFAGGLLLVGALLAALRRRKLKRWNAVMVAAVRG